MSCTATGITSGVPIVFNATGKSGSGMHVGLAALTAAAAQASGIDCVAMHD